MMEEGTLDSTVEQLQARLDKLGSTVSISAANYTTSISVSSLEKNLPQTLAIVEECYLNLRLMNPTLNVISNRC